ncbi:unnamed protein product, partial [Durusdinium trenchii]
VSEIYLTKQRFENPDDKATSDERQQMRSVLGCLAWHAGQLAMEWGAETRTFSGSAVLEEVQQTSVS